MGWDHDRLMHDFVVGRYPELRRAAYLMCGDWKHADDLVRRTMAKMVAGRRRRARHLDPLSRRAVMNAFRGGWRTWFRRRVHLFHAVGDTGGQGAPGRPDGGLDPVVRVAVLAALHQLPPRRRAVVVLHHWENLSLQETAATLGMSARAVSAHSEAGTAVLRAAVGGLLAERPGAVPTGGAR